MLKKSLEDYRPNAAGSIIDEYERAFFEIKSILQNISEEDYTRISDAETKNEDCRSIETMMNHVVRSGYFYANYIRESLSMKIQPVGEMKISHAEICNEIDKMLAYTLEIFEGRWKEMDEQLGKVFINSRWGITYNIDQMLEHAIVHVLRHRRQIEKFLLTFQD
ncbi:MAG: DinB family protein [Aridibacter sp.]